MARLEGPRALSTAPRLIALDGINGRALGQAARALAAADRRRRAAVSYWDASGIFAEIAVADVGAGDPSARTLLLLYAADLAFRLRWEIRPALAAGRLVIAAPYVDTAIAFGRANGIEADWLTDMFGFAPRADFRRLVDAPAARLRAQRKGFVEFACGQVLAARAGDTRGRLIRRTSLQLKALVRRVY